MWEEFGVWSSSIPIERFYNAGLSTDGRLCIATDIDSLFAVWSIDQHQQIWSHEEDDEVIDAALADWGNSTHFAFTIEPVKSRYRLFGLEHNYPLEINAQHDSQIQIWSQTREVAVQNIQDKTQLQRLKYRDFSGDWVFATFSDDGSTLAVLTPYDISFFRYHQSE